MPRYKELRQAKDLQARQVAEAAGIDPTMYSRFENYRVLPIPAEFCKLVEALGCLPADVYDPEEVALLPTANKVEATGGARVHQQPDHYQMTVRLGNDYRDVLTRTVLQKCGYKSINDWVIACVQRLKSQYEIILKAEKKPRQPSAKRTSGVGDERRGIPLTNPSNPTTILSEQNKNVKEAYQNENNL